jgi:hypothetical protein
MQKKKKEISLNGVVPLPKYGDEVKSCIAPHFVSPSPNLQHCPI